MGHNGDRDSVRVPHFVTRGEREFAGLLDYYRIEWQYEPRSFPLRWDDEGRVVEAFTPDFYLPDQDLYVELTSMRQSLVSRKNRKLRMLRELYPEINVKLLYRGDCQALLAKHGIDSDAEHGIGDAEYGIRATPEPEAEGPLS
ncbi:MAG: PDDEXK family nuclease [Anaerolineae bacterium]